MAAPSWPRPDTGGLSTNKPTQKPVAKPAGKSVWLALRLKRENSA